MKNSKVKMTPIAWVVLVISLALTLYLYLPMIGGIISIASPIGDTSKASPPLSTESLTGLIILATALGGFILWFVGRYPKTALQTDSFVRSIKFAGTLFLYSALLLSLAMILSPLIPSIRESTDWYYVSLRYIAAFAFIGGGVAFILANITSLIYAWKL
jgi:hypothetical protein